MRECSPPPPPPKHVICHVSHVTCHVSCVTCHMSHVTFFFSSSFSDKVVKLIGGGSVINGAYPVLFTLDIHKNHSGFFVKYCRSNPRTLTYLKIFPDFRTYIQVYLPKTKIFVFSYSQRILYFSFNTICLVKPISNRLCVTKVGIPR